MHPDYVRIDPERLRHLYLDEQLSTAAIAAQLACSPITVLRRLHRLDIAVRPRGPNPKRRPYDLVRRKSFEEWSTDLAYAVGLLATDGNLSPDGRHLEIPSKDHALLETLKSCLGLGNAITPHSSGSAIHRLQWGDRQFYDWLMSIGLTPAKSLTLGPLAVPDEYFADFLRGCIDGDGSITTYTDRYNTFRNPQYVYTRLYVSLVSASFRFVDWVRATVQRLIGLSGYVSARRSPMRNPIWRLAYAKRESLALLRWIYYNADVPCLARKRDIAASFLVCHAAPRHRGPGRPMVI
jgi:hypothetical protein